MENTKNDAGIVYEQEEGQCVARTASGHYFDLLDAKPSDIKISDIATGLSNICRFGGQVKERYSVAEHSVHCAARAAFDGHTRKTCLAVLMHDAAEAYAGDVIRSVKHVIHELYHPIEKALEKAIGIRFGIDFDEYHDVIKYYDNNMLFAEKQFLFPHDKRRWKGELDRVPFSPLFGNWNEELARTKFLSKYIDLQYGDIVVEPFNGESFFTDLMLVSDEKAPA